MYGDGYLQLPLTDLSVVPRALILDDEWIADSDLCIGLDQRAFEFFEA